jgi:hypothetical protein
VGISYQSEFAGTKGYETGQHPPETCKYRDLELRLPKADSYLRSI